MMKNLLAVLYCFVFITLSALPIVEAREPTDFEWICLNTVYEIEKHIALKLNYSYPEHAIVETHPSPLGPMLVRAEFIRDCWIRGPIDVETGHAKGIDLIIFLFDEKLPKAHWTKSLLTSKHRLVAKNGNEEVIIRIGILSENKVLRDDIVNWIDEMKLGATSPNSE